MPATETAADQRRYAILRQAMIDQQLWARGVQNERVLAAFEQTPRHWFVPAALRDRAYDDYPLPIAAGQTISQPYVVGLMTQLVLPPPGGKALDVGSGSGFQAALLSRLCREVVSLEIVPELAQTAAERLAALGIANVQVHLSDGSVGWPPGAPYDAIVVAAAAPRAPPALIEQLAPGGRLVLPIGDYEQNLWLVEKTREGAVRQSDLGPVAFVPMTGQVRGE